MQVGAVLFFQNFENNSTDRKTWDANLHIGKLLEPLGYDFIGVVEHHFEGYSTVSDNFQVLSHLAATTNRIGLMTSAVILPWNDPLRVAERLLVLDYLSNGRAMFGMGRGLARMEYESFGIDMNEARDRFDEAAEVVMRALETGVYSGDGKFYGKDKPIEIRPEPMRSFKDRTYCVAMSSDSVPVAARLGAPMLAFASKPWEDMVPTLEGYRTEWLKHHVGTPPSPAFCNFLLCDENGDRAEEMAHKYMGRYYDSLIAHYEMAGAHFKNIKGYSDYAAGAEALIEEAELAKRREAYIQMQDFGTPQRILEEYERRRGLLGDFNLILNVIYGNMPTEYAEQSVRLFSRKVLPELKKLKAVA